MTAVTSSRRSRRGSSQGFGPGRSQGPAVSLPTRIGLTLVPGILYLAHLTFGANQPAAALWLTVGLALALVIALITPLRAGLYDLPNTAWLSVLFGLTVAAALWSLTPWAPGGSHPIWAWAGITPGALSVNRTATIVEIVKLLGLAAIFLVGALQGIRRDRATATLEGVVWTGGLWSAISLLMFLGGTQIAQIGRLTGGFLSANSGATVFGVLTVLGLTLFLRGWRRTSGQGLPDRLTTASGPIACVLLSAVCLLLTASRMGVAATVLAIGVLLLWSLATDAKGRGPVVISGLVLIALSGVMIAGGNDLLWSRADRLATDVDNRAVIFSAHWEAFLASPLSGYGLGTFDAVNMQIMTAETANALWSIRATHNVYLQWLEEAGLIGALPMFALIGFMVSVAVFRVGGRGKLLQQGLICSSLVVLVHGLTDYGLQVPSVAAFWAFLLGLQFAFGQGRG